MDGRYCRPRGSGYYKERARRGKSSLFYTFRDKKMRYNRDSTEEQLVMNVEQRMEVRKMEREAKQMGRRWERRGKGGGGGDCCQGSIYMRAGCRDRRRERGDPPVSRPSSAVYRRKQRSRCKQQMYCADMTNEFSPLCPRQRHCCLCKHVNVP